ncbi:MAG TPA: DNA gyrase subunit A [Firmicutes bacterium]|nr:DNA gyrase subunit A [Bacillota bacterium]
MLEYTHGKIIPVNIEEEMKKSYLDYAMSVIVGRALPDVRDGLKPVHRRILYAMHELAITPDKPHKKSARVVGEVLGKYHPHGDAAVYDTIVRMAQDFAIRYPLIDGHGNFGSVDGDSAAAMRYTEVRLSKIAMELLAGIDKETVDFIPNFDESLEEPQVLPARFPNLLVNGSAGIAVGMATNIPPHNLGEVIDGLVLLIDKPEATIKELMQVIKGPDFPTGGLILGRDGIRAAYEKGRGAVKIRAKTQIERLKNGKSQIIVTEIPYQVNKARMIERIAELVREKKLDGITDLRDESDRNGIRIVIEMRRDVDPRIILNRLYKHTQMQESFGIIMLALVDGTPMILNLKEMLSHYLEHQKEIVTRRTRYELKKAEARAHILEGLRIALDHLDAVIALIRGSRTVDEARSGLMEQFGLSREQAQAILDMRLQKLTGLEREKIDEEYRELIARIEYLTSILASEAMVYQIVRKELLEIKEKYADPRRTKITSAQGEMELEDLIPREDVVITITHAGYIKRMPVSTYRSQNRGGRGMVGLTPREDDFVEHLFIATTHHHILFFTNRGLVYRLKVYDVPEGGRQARGTALVNLIGLAPGEKITAVIPVQDFSQDGYLIMATRQGLVKKTDLAEFENIRRNGLIAITLEEGDDLIDVRLTRGDQEVILGTRLGKAIRFPEDDVRSMGRTARGVKAITLEEDDAVIGMEKVQADADLLVVTKNGFGKRTPIEEYRLQKRGGKGIKNIRLTRRTGEVVGIKVVKPGNELMLVTTQGIMIRLKVDDISKRGRDTQGVTLMRMNEGDELVAVARLMEQGNGDGEGKNK